MQKKPLFQGMLKAILLCLIGLALLVITTSNVQAQDDTAIPLSEAAYRVNVEYIPSAAQALAAKRGDSAALWGKRPQGPATDAVPTHRL